MRVRAVHMFDRAFPVRRLALIVVFVAGTAACADRTPVEPATSGSRLATGLPDSAPPRVTLDEEFEFIARHEIPGFAGYYLRDGELVVLLKDMSQRTAALNLAAQRTARSLGKLGVARAAVREVNFDFVQLAQWYRLLMDELGNHIDDLLVDIDEVDNRILIGYQDERISAAVRSIAARSGIPSLAIAVEYRILPIPLLTLQNNFPSMQGGIQVNVSDPSRGPCTLGFNVVYQALPGFVTNSHCTLDDFAPDGGPFDQVFGRRVGVEVWDPIKHKCFTFGKCRWSDAAIVRYDAGVSYDIGVVAWPSPEGYGGPGSIDVGDPPNWYYISTKWTTPIPLGAPAYKIGATSGRTIGNVVQSCVTVLGLLCQYKADIWAEPGDSGSPFLLTTGPGATIAGIMWGGHESFTESWYSPMEGIERDLGSSLVPVCYPGWGC